jgi:antitoxin (DNA-binding transcriptional repressor) of toxin-antitoxin stability system
MSAISDELAKIKAAQDVTITNLGAVAAGVSGLDAKVQADADTIAALQAQIASSASTLTPEDQKALDDIVTSTQATADTSGALATQATAVATSPATPVAPLPSTPPTV